MVKPSKCHFLQPQVDFLGHTFSGKGLSISPKNIKRIKDMEPPKSVRELRRWTGLTSFVRKLCNYADITLPIMNLLKKDNMFEWSEQTQNNFDTLKQAITLAPCVGYPDFSKEFLVLADSSGKALGGMVAQV